MLKASILSFAVVVVLAACTPTEEDGSPASTIASMSTKSGQEAEGAPISDGDTAGEETDNGLALADSGSTEVTCTYPVKTGDTGESLAERFGRNAEFETLNGPEGMEMPGVVLWQGDEARAIEVAFEDEARTALSFVRIVGSDWSILGLQNGDTLETVSSVNAAPIKFYGFEWDYSGAVFGFEGGTLDNIGACSVQMSFIFDWEAGGYSDRFAGEVQLSSEDKDIDQTKILIAELGVGFALSE